VLLAACGTASHQVRDYVAAHYDVISRSNNTVEARSEQSVEAVAAQITGRYSPKDRYDNDAGTFIRYNDEFVAVRPDPSGGTLISADSDQRGSNRWVPIIGPIFLPGGRFGGPGESNRGGGPGSGK
jgi:hypothetical protein